MKQNLKLLLVMMVCFLTSSLSSFAYDFEVDGIYYDFVSLADRTCEVCAGDTKYEGDIVIPSTVEYKNNSIKVVSIGREAFWDCSSLTSVIIPEGVTGIGVWAFYKCSSLTSIIIPEGVTGIGSYAFYGCSSLTSVIIPGSVTYIGDSAFYGCSSLTSIIIPGSVTYIGDSAFYYCSSLTSIIIPESVAEIRKSAFCNCSSLTSIIIPESVTKIGDSAFVCCSSLTSIIIPESVTEIGSDAFSGCSSLTSIIIPESVTKIGDSAFYRCSSLTSIRLSKNLTRIMYGLFSYCESLKSITIPGSAELIFFDKYKYEDDGYRFETFIGCDNLKSLKIEYSSVPMGAKYHRSGYSSGYSNYYWKFKVMTEMTNRIENLYIDRELEMYYSSDYLSFESLKDLTLGEHIADLQIKGRNAPKLETITCYATTPPSNVDFETNQYTDIIVKVPYEALEAYKTAKGWKNFWNIEGFHPAGVQDINSDLSDSTYNRREVSRYNLNGQPVSEDYKGVVIVRFSDGSTKKIMQ